MITKPLKSTTFIDNRKAALRDLDDLASEPGVYCAVDTEFDKNDRLDRDLVIWSRSRRKGERVVITADLATSVYSSWLEDKRYPKVWSDYRADYPVFGKLGIKMSASFGADIVHQDFYDDENELKHGLKDQCLRHLRKRRKSYAELFSYLPEGKKKRIVLMPGEIMGLKPFPPEALKYMAQEEWRKKLIEYSGDDGEDTIMLFEIHRKKMQSIGYWDNYNTIDRPFTITVQRMQRRGMLLDLDLLKQIRSQVRQDAARSSHVFKALTDAPEDINLNSKDQLRAHLIDGLGWPVYDDLRTDQTRLPQINQEALKRWKKDGFPLAGLILDRNAKTKLASDVTGLVEGVSPDIRIRSDLKQLGTSTARLASRKWTEIREHTKVLKNGTVKTTLKKKQVGANLFNVASKKEKDPYGIRRGFVAPKIGQITADGKVAEEDYSLIIADQAGFELVIATHWATLFVPDSKAAKLINKYGTASVVHADTAIEVFKIPVSVDKWMANPDGYKKKYKREYDIGKILNFSLLYNGNEWTVCNKLDWDTRDDDKIEEARSFVQQWEASKPEFPIYGRQMVKHGYEHGWVPTLAGARQHVGVGLASTDKGIKRHWESKCKNGPVQTSASQILMVAQNTIERDKELRSWGYRQIIQVYDEIVGESPTRTAQKCKERVDWHMRQPYKNKLRVPLTVESKVANSWGEK